MQHPRPFRISLLCLALAATSLAPKSATAATGVVRSGAPTTHTADPAHLAAEQTIAVLRARAPRLRVAWQRDGRLPALIAGLAVPTQGESPTARARRFLLAHPALIGGAATQLREAGVSQSHGRTVVRFEAMVADLPLLDRSLSVSLDAEQRVFALVSDLPVPAAIPDAKISAATASAAVRALPRMAKAALAAPVAAIWQPAGLPLRVWMVDTVVVAGASHVRVLVDATTGQVVAQTERVIR